MKILHIVGSIDKSAGGPSRSVPQSCEQLSKLGVTIELTGRPSADPIPTNTSDTFKVMFRSLKQLVVYSFRLSKNDIDLIHLQHVWDPYIHVVAWAARHKGIPYIITPRGMLEPWIMNRHSWKKKLAMFLYQRKDIEQAACIHATCVMEKDNICKLGFTNPIVVIPNGLDLSLVPRIKTEYGAKKIVFLSRIHPKKGIEILLEAWQKLDNTDWTLEIAGKGEVGYINKLQNKIKVEKINNVLFVGPMYGVAKWDFLRSADVLVLPTYSENFGIVVAEALVVGVPVITTTGTPWQELETQQCGWWIELSVHNLMKTLKEAIYCSPNELKEMGLRGKKLVEAQYDIKSVGLDIKALYQRIIG